MATLKEVSKRGKREKKDERKEGKVPVMAVKKPSRLGYGNNELEGNSPTEKRSEIDY